MGYKISGRGQTECGRDDGVHTLPGARVAESADEVYPGKCKDRVRSGYEDRIELEEQVKAEHCRIGQRSGDPVQCGGLCRPRGRIKQAVVCELAIICCMSIWEGKVSFGVRESSGG